MTQAEDLFSAQFEDMAFFDSSECHEVEEVFVCFSEPITLRVNKSSVSIYFEAFFIWKVLSSRVQG